jgi:rhodanese-related sulfurtransferase
MPTHLTEALRTNMSGGKTVAQMLAEAAAQVPFMSMGELQRLPRLRTQRLIVLDVRERDAFEEGHIPGARLLPRGQLELRVNQELPDPTRSILTYCEFGRISTLAAATLAPDGFPSAVALDGGMKAWREAGYEYASQNFVVIGVNVDKDRDRAERFLNETPAEFPIVYDPKGELATIYKVAGMPSGILIDRAGHVRFQHSGFSDKQKGLYEEQLQKLLAESAH